MHLPVPLRGMLSVPFRAFGIRPSKMNPNTCTICELMFTRVMKARKVSVDATVLFADLRGYTGLSQSLSPDAISGLLDTFYDECANAIWAYDGLLNKTIGDAVMAIFNFPIRGEDHANRAVRAAREIQKRWASERETLARTLGVDGSELGVGIGIHSGELSFGEFGRSHRDCRNRHGCKHRFASANGADADQSWSGESISARDRLRRRQKRILKALGAVGFAA
jgi:hypothetical protein